MSNRSLSSLEKELLDKLLSKPFLGSKELVLQAANCKAESTNDEDNYGSIYLKTQVAKPAVVRLRVPVEGLIEDSDGETVDILLHVVDGYLNELEIVKLNGTPLRSKLDPSRMKIILND